MHSIVEQHGGMIHLTSARGSGSSFQIYFPCVDRQLDAAAKRGEEIFEGGSETILVAEDDAMARRLLVSVLKKAGYTVLSAENGMEAVRVFEANVDRIDLVLLDVIMPLMGGLAARDHIAEIRQRTRFIFSSGYDADVDHIESLVGKKTPWISKPYMPAVLLKLVRQVLDA